MSHLKEVEALGGGVYQCDCGSMIRVNWPRRCFCGREFLLWRTITGEMIPLSEMKADHLSNVIRFIAEKIEKLRSGQNLWVDGVGPRQERERLLEEALDFLYAELGTRTEEIEKSSKIYGALLRSIRQ